MFVFTNRCSLLSAVLVCAFGFIPSMLREQKTQKPEMRWSIYWITWMAHIKHANENWKRKEKKQKNNNNIRHAHTHARSQRDPYRLTLVNNFSFLFWRVRVCVCEHIAPYNPLPSIYFLIQCVQPTTHPLVRPASSQHFLQSSHSESLTFWLRCMCHAHSISTKFRSSHILPRSLTHSFIASCYLHVRHRAIRLADFVSYSLPSLFDHVVTRYKCEHTHTCMHVICERVCLCASEGYLNLWFSVQPSNE